MAFFCSARLFFARSCDNKVVIIETKNYASTALLEIIPVKLALNLSMFFLLNIKMPSIYYCVNNGDLDLSN